MDFLFYMGAVFLINFGLLLLGTVGGLILGATLAFRQQWRWPFDPVHLPVRTAARPDLAWCGVYLHRRWWGGQRHSFKDPGAPANIATTLDGHTMATEEGQRPTTVLPRLSRGRYFWRFLLIFLTPVLAQWALAFGPSHLSGLRSWV